MRRQAAAEYLQQQGLVVRGAHLQRIQVAAGVATAGQALLGQLRGVFAWGEGTLLLLAISY
ncbi:hypothetical protein A9G05_23755 [Pseudomonas sp. ENNP23]|nr:hypothetical protein A9G05_23755 [Pseudomonas sp. ENNP23]